MQMTLEQAFAADLAMLISEYITKGLDRNVIEEELHVAIDDLFNCDEEPDE